MLQSRESSWIGKTALPEIYINSIVFSSTTSSHLRYAVEILTSSSSAKRDCVHHDDAIHCEISTSAKTPLSSFQSNKTLREKEEKKSKTYERLLSPSFLNISITLNISFLPPVASTFLPFILILTLSCACACKSLPNNKCCISKHTKTPQSLPFSCCGESSKFTNFKGFCRSCEIC
jgi:hypothetical protein